MAWSPRLVGPFTDQAAEQPGTRGPLLMRVIVGSIRKVSEVVLLLDTFLRTREARTSIAEAKKF